METNNNATPTGFNAPSSRRRTGAGYGAGCWGGDGSTYGRDLLRDDVRELLHRRPIVTLVGAAGVGKSQLAAAVVSSMTTDPGWGQVCWFDATRAGVQDLTGDDNDMDGAGGTGHAGSELSETQILVVDGFDRVDGPGRLAETAILYELIYRLPGLGILVTARRPLDVAGEQVVRIGPLPLPHRSSLAPLRGPAVDLLVERASAIDRRFDLGAEDDVSIRDLLRRTGGYPSAIAALAERLAVTPGRLLARDAATGTPLMTPIRAIATLDSCLTALEPPETALLELLAAAARPVTEQTVTAAGGDGAALSSLVERSLVELRRRTGASATYSLPPTTAAAVGPPPPTAVDAIHAALIAWAHESQDLSNPSNPCNLNDLSVEIEAFEQAIDDLVSAQRATEAATLAVAVAPAWADVCRPGPARRLLATLAEQPLPNGLARSVDLWRAVLDVRYGQPRSERDLDDLADRLNAAAGPPPPVPASPSSLNDYRHSAVDDTARFLALSALAELQTRRPERSIQAVAAAAAARDLAEQARNTRWQAEAAFATALVRRAIGDSEGATAAVIDASQLAARSHNQRVAIRCELLLCEHRTRSAATGRADTGSRLGVTLRDLRPRADRIGDRRCRILVDLAEVIGTAHEPVGEAERRLIALIDEVHADGDHVLGRLVTFAAAALCAARGEAEVATTLIHTLPCIDEAASLAPAQLAAGYVELCRKVEQSLGRSGRTAARVTATHLDEAGALALARRTLESVAERGDLSPDSPTRTGLATPGDPERLDSLTARETDVLGWMAEGLSNKDIARELGVSAKTVMHHAGAIYRKLRVSGRGEAAAAVLQGRVELERPPRSA